MRLHATPAVDELLDVVERIRDVLESYLRATGKDTGITKAFMANAKSLVSVLPALNITNGLSSS